MIDEMDDATSELVAWRGANVNPDIAEWGCTCGHGSLGPSWHNHDCFAALVAWRNLAIRRHTEAWELLDEVKYLVGIIQQQARTLDSLLAEQTRSCLVGEILGHSPCVAR